MYKLVLTVSYPSRATIWGKKLPTDASGTPRPSASMAHTEYRQSLMKGRKASRQSICSPILSVPS